MATVPTMPIMQERHPQLGVRRRTRCPPAPGPWPGPPAPGGELAGADGQQAADDGDERHGVEGEARADVDQARWPAGQGRPDDPGAVEHGAVEADPLVRSSSQTNSETNAWRVGLSSVVIDPLDGGEDVERGERGVTGRARKMARAVAWMPSTVWVPIEDLPLVNRSAMSPPWMLPSRVGTNCTATTTPIWVGLLVIW